MGELRNGSARRAGVAGGRSGCLFEYLEILEGVTRQGISVGIFGPSQRPEGAGDVGVPRRHFIQLIQYIKRFQRSYALPLLSWKFVNEH
jgi:hypothetical protein